MTKIEANRIIRKLEGIFPNQFKSDAMKKEYAEAFQDWDYDLAEKTINKIRIDGVEREDGTINRTYLPSIAEIYFIYCQFKEKKQARSIENKDYCDVCDNKGFVLAKEIVQLSETSKMPYDFVYYCPYCAVGSLYAYDGRQCKEKSDYRIPSIAEVFGNEVINQLRKQNRALQQKRENSTERNRKDDLKVVAVKIGRTIEDARYYADDFEPGDAFEVVEMEDGLPV